MLSREVPKCTVCGYIGEWKNERFSHPLPFIIAGIILFLAMIDIATEAEAFSGVMIGVGIFYAIYLFFYCIDRGIKKKARICSKCNSVDQFTFIY